LQLPSLTTIGVVFIASELGLMLLKRSKAGTAAKDRYSLPLLWLVITASLWLGFEVRARFPAGRLPAPQILYPIGIALFILGLIVRWAAIIYLGRLFTVNVAIASDHQLITTGPYRFVRHPSYTGSLFLFVGFSLCMLNILSMAVVLLPISAAFRWRMKVEENALLEAFGDRYQAYAATTPRLIPLVY
jgi:protein-S-isoprenylcysteine O-methyltransferase